jgi:hypothetical protein
MENDKLMYMVAEARLECAEMKVKYSDAYLRARLLQLEVDALRSVLSEFEGNKDHFLQMNEADAINSVLNSLKPL